MNCGYHILMGIATLRFSRTAVCTFALFQCGRYPDNVLLLLESHYNCSPVVCYKLRDEERAYD
jgi:hypothetical protein